MVYGFRSFYLVPYVQKSVALCAVQLSTIRAYKCYAEARSHARCYEKRFYDPATGAAAEAPAAGGPRLALFETSTTAPSGIAASKSFSPASSSAPPPPAASRVMTASDAEGNEAWHRYAISGEEAEA